MKHLIAALFTLVCAPALAAQAPDTSFVTGPNFQQTPPSKVFVTPTGGTQQTLPDALSPQGLNLTGANASGANVTATGTATARTEATRAADVANILDQGAKCDGTTPDDAAFAAAIATGKSSIVIPAGSGAVCVVSGTLTPASGQTISGLNGVPTIKLVSGSVSRLFQLTGLNHVTLQNLILDGSAAASGGEFIRFNGTTDSILRNVQIVSAPGDSSTGSIVISGASTNNVIIGGKFNNTAGNANIALTGSGVLHNQISDNYFHGATNFSIRLISGANRNEISSNYIDSSGIEPIAVSLGAQYNRILGNHVEGSGDNGISIVGDHNIIANNAMVKNAKAGIYLWGAFNTVTGNSGLDNNLIGGGATWACIGANADFGATAQFNTVTGNTCDDDQGVPTQYGISLKGIGYTVWSAGASVTSGTYWYFGLNIYQAGSTATAGATAPTCTTGTCSDGTITWTYKGTFVTDLLQHASVSSNEVPRYAGTAGATDTLNWADSQLVSASDNRLTPPSLVVGGGLAGVPYTSATSLIIRSANNNPGIVLDTTNASATGAITWGFGGAIQARIDYGFSTGIFTFTSNGVARTLLSATVYRPTTNNAIANGASAQRWSTTFTVNLDASSVILSNPLTVATLPTCNAGADGTWNKVTDATTPTYNAALTGGGAVHVPVYCDGTSWKSH